MPYSSVFLKVLGFRGLISEVSSTNNDEEDDIVVTVNADDTVSRDVISRDVSWYRKSHIRYPVNMLYVLTIATIILWPFIFAVIQAISHKDFKYITSNIFTLSFIVQYATGLWYYQSDHFMNIVKSKKKYRTNIFAAFTFGFICSFILAVLALIFLVLGTNIVIYTELYNNANASQKALLAITILLDKFYSYSIFFTNLVAFTIVFSIHSDDINKYATKLGNYVANNEQGLTIESITKDYTDLKSQHASSVTNLNTIFSTITVMGSIGSYYVTVHYGTLFAGWLEIVDVCCFILIESTYIYAITRVKGSVSNISSIINSPNFTDRFLSRADLVDFAGDIIHMEPRSKTVPPVEDVIEKVRLLNSVNEGAGRTDQQVNHTKIDLIKDIVLRNMIKGHENAEGIDWTILNTKLSGSWENFQLLGYSIDDATVMKKTGTAIIGLMMMFHLNNTIGF